jgi:hypothetical protein
MCGYRLLAGFDRSLAARGGSAEVGDKADIA